MVSESRRVTGSVLEAEIIAMTLDFDVLATIRLAVSVVFGRVIQMKIYTDSKSTFDCFTNVNPMKERRLLVDLRLLRQSYECCGIT